MAVNNTSHKELVHYALIGLEEQKKQIDEKISEFRALLSDAPSSGNAEVSDSTPRKSAAKKKGMSAAGRERIAAAQRARWAARRGEVAGTKGGATPKQSSSKGVKKRSMSTEARARIAEAQRKRWAATRKQGK